MISRSSLNGAYPLKELGELVEFLDSQRKPVTESLRKPGPYPYFGANGQQGTIDGFLFDEPLVLLAEDGGQFETPTEVLLIELAAKPGSIITRMCLGRSRRSTWIICVGCLRTTT